MIKVKAANAGQGTSRLSSFLFGGGGRADKSELLAAIPPRAAVDKLIVRYFNSFDPVIREFTTADIGLFPFAKRHSQV
jgi:hypothetical protein